MPQQVKISIIIPVYNREDLLPYTLDSLLKQSFNDWECILVDDQSTDCSLEVLEDYKRKDNRFKVYQRPIELKKGANACRNFGYTKSTGSYIKWFDSDDIMLPNHLEAAYNTIVENCLDFVVTDTLNFNHFTNELSGSPYNFDKNQVINAENMALNRIGWITNDFLGNREVVDKINFNENIITDGDEYNFFVRLLHITKKGVFVNQVATHRRMHDDSLTTIHNIESSGYLLKIANIKIQTAQDLVVYNNVKLIKWFLSGYMQTSFKLALIKKQPPLKIEAFKMISIYYSKPKAIAFLISFYLGYSIKRGYNIMKYARK